MITNDLVVIAGIRCRTGMARRCQKRWHCVTSCRLSYPCRQTMETGHVGYVQVLMRFRNICVWY